MGGEQTLAPRWFGYCVNHIPAISKARQLLTKQTRHTRAAARIENGQLTEAWIMIAQISMSQQLGSILTQHPMTLL
jgi:hypothetical protein